MSAANRLRAARTSSSATVPRDALTTTSRPGPSSVQERARCREGSWSDRTAETVGAYCGAANRRAGPAGRRGRCARTTVGGAEIRTRRCLAVLAPSRGQSTPGSGLLRAPRRRNSAGPSTGHGASRRNYAAPRLRYAAASAIALRKCAAVAGVALVRRGLRRRSSKYAAAVRLVKRRSPAMRRERRGAYPVN